MSAEKKPLIITASAVQREILKKYFPETYIRVQGEALMALPVTCIIVCPGVDVRSQWFQKVAMLRLPQRGMVFEINGLPVPLEE